MKVESLKTTDKPSAAPHKINVFTLVMITAAFVISVRNLPMMAETGLNMIFYALIAALAFLVPTALVSAELATGWPEQGGVYVWVKEAFGERLGFTAIWLQWFQMVIGMVAVLVFIAGSLAFVFNPALAENKVFILAVVLVVYWGATYLNLRGMKTSGKISTVCFLCGVLVPGLLIIILGIVYLLSGNPVQLDLSLNEANLIPDFSSISNIVLLAGFIFIFAGIEVSAGHANEVKNPQRNYPAAIFIAGLVLFLINVMGGMAVAIVVPQQNISLDAGIMVAFTDFFAAFGIAWLVPIIALLVAFGAIGQISTWILGPVKGLQVSADMGDLPPFLQKVNENGIPKNLLILQASLVSVFGLMFALVPGVNNAYWMLLALTILVYLVMYLLMFLAAIRLRYSRPEVHRAYKIAGGKAGMWFVSGIGILTVLFTMIVGFFPPKQIPAGNGTLYMAIMGAGLLIIVLIPLIIYHFKKPGWIPNTGKKEV